MILAASRPDDLVLDPFCGTGTTLLAAANAGRNGIGVELDAAYARMAALRLKSEVGNLFQGVRLEFLRSESLDSGILHEETTTAFLPTITPRNSITYSQPARKKRKAPS